jgi:hypothetical protein
VSAAAPRPPKAVLDQAGPSIAGFNMNTPGVAGGMAPSAYPVLVPEAEGQAARQFLSDLAHNPPDDSHEAADASDQTDEYDNSHGGGAIGRLRPVVRVLVVALLVLWFVATCLLLLRRCSLV